VARELPRPGAGVNDLGFSEDGGTLYAATQAGALMRYELAGEAVPLPLLQHGFGINQLVVTEEWIAAAFAADQDRTDAQRDLLACSDRLIAELAEADVIVIATPMYNYGMPATLKAWFDQVIRVNETFSFDLSRGDYPLQPVLSGKRLVVLTSTGEFGFMRGGVRSHMNHLLPHIATCASYLGVAEQDIHHVGIEYQEFRDERHERSIADAYRAIPGLVDRLARASPVQLRR